MRRKSRWAVCVLRSRRRAKHLDANSRNRTSTAYHHAKTRAFRDAIQSGCGGPSPATGPFIAPKMKKVYIDLGFFDELSRRFGAPGQFAQAYVLAHELGHHVQKLLGIEARVHQLQEDDSRQEKSPIREARIAADCFAGVWAHSTQQRGLLEKGTSNRRWAPHRPWAMTVCRRVTGRVNPESFTHGSSHSECSGLRRGWIKD